jgi:protein-L-isoaspartate(D-aspartate) O-methyltransferase
MMRTEEAREQMIEQQVRAWDVLDERVLSIMRLVPREHFVSPQHRFLAFADVEIPLPHAQHMLRPSVAGGSCRRSTLRVRNGCWRWAPAPDS